MRYKMNYLLIGIIGVFIGVGLASVSAQIADNANNKTKPEEDFTPVEEDYGEEEEKVYGKFNRN